MHSQGTTDAINDVRNINILKFKKASGNAIKQAPVVVVVVIMLVGFTNTYAIRTYHH